MTDSTMLERVQQAIAKGIEDRASLRDVARAAIEAMMEPTAAMLKAGDIPGWDDSVTVDLAGEIWQAMLSEALRSSRKGDEPRQPGFLSTLTPEQRTEALKGFDGDDTLGDPASLKGEGE